MMEYGCIGEKLPHSFSKEIHEKIGSYRYELKELSPDELGSFMEEADFRAINVTIPYKEAVIPYLYETDPLAASVGAVNTIVNRNGLLYGYNTDVYGMKALLKKEDITLQHKKVLILGTGGTSKTAKAVAETLDAAEIIKVSRSAGEDGVVSYNEAATLHKDAQVIINTTPVGMFPNIWNSPIDIDAFPDLSAVVDAVYNPLKTLLVQNALKKGLRAQTGLYMLVAQAVRAYEIFMDTAAPPYCADTIYKEILSAKQNIVLIGMPGSGKSTVGKTIAQKLERPFYDTDELIRKSAGAEISDIFKSRGESVFRDMETDIIRELSARSGCVISTGGGAVLRQQNIDLLKMNGIIYFLDRSPSLLVPTADRPLALDRDAITQRYKERYGIYTSVADHIIDNNDSAEDAVFEIERRHMK